MDEVKEQIKEKEKAMRPLKQKLECVSPLHPLLSPFALRCRETLTRPVCREYEAKIKQFDVKKQKGAEELVRLDRQRKNIGIRRPRTQLNMWPHAPRHTHTHTHAHHGTRTC
jgi:hypothetical protein